MKAVHAKSFFEALRILHSNPKKAASYLKDKRLTNAEKKILECWLLLADNHYAKIMAILSTLSVRHDPLIDAQKNLIMGITLNNISESGKAIPLMRSAFEVIREYPLERHRFIAIHNLFIAHLNYKDGPGMKFCLEEMGKIKFESDRQRVCFHHAQFNFHAFKGELQEAWQYLKKAEEFQDEITGVMAIGHLVNHYVYFVKTGEFEKCSEVLAELKNQRKFYHTENFNFMKMMLDHLLNDQPLYVYASDFRDHQTLYYQLKVIQCFEEEDRQGALRYWNELHRAVPHVYLEEFNYQGDVSIFSLCLKKYIALESAPQAFNPSDLPEGKEERLVFILNQLAAPIKKELLYEYVWGQPTDNKDEFMRLIKLVSRLRAKGMNVVYRKGCYQLVRDSEEKSAA